MSSIQEAQLAIPYGASALGLVSAMPSGPGIIEEELIAEIAETIPPAVSSFLLTSQQDPENQALLQSVSGHAILLPSRDARVRCLPRSRAMIIMRQRGMAVSTAALSGFLSRPWDVARQRTSTRTRRLSPIFELFFELVR